MLVILEQCLFTTQILTISSGECMKNLKKTNNQTLCGCNNIPYDSEAFQPITNNLIPLMTLKKFAEETGLEIAGPTVVYGMVQRKALPTVKIGKHRLIDMDALRAMIANQREQSC